MRQSDVTEIVGAIYDAAGESLSWTELGEQLCALVKAQRVYLGIPQPDGTLPNLLRPPDAFDTAYATRYHKVDPFRALAARAGQPGVRRGTDIISSRDLRHSEYFADYARLRGGGHSIGGQLNKRGDLLIGIFREGSGGPFSDAELGSIAFLLPHLQRGLQLRKIFTGGQPAIFSSGLAALDALPISAILVDAAMRVVFANAAANRITSEPLSGLRIVRAGGVLGTVHCMLSASHRSDTSALASLVAATAAHGPGGSLRLRPPESDGVRSPLIVVLVTPAPARLISANPFSGAAGLVHDLVLVFARDLAALDAPPPRLLSDLFHLSNGEAAIASAILGGATAESVAEARHVSLNTVRRQIQDVLRKTEAANLRDLERIAASLASMHAPMPDV
jgi:DNA-binding CsgD family transcriptional regulator